MSAVILLSLGAQLKLPMPQYGNSKPKILETIAPETAKDGVGEEGLRCVAVAWVPKTDGGSFIVAHAGGSIQTLSLIHISEPTRPY